MAETDEPPRSPAQLLTAHQFGRFLAVCIRGRLTQRALWRATDQLNRDAPDAVPLVLSTQRISAMENSKFGSLPAPDELRSYLHGCGAAERFEELDAARRRLLDQQRDEERARMTGSPALPPEDRAPARTAVPVALAGLPPDEGFTGRAAELAELRDALAPGEAATSVALVAGLAGVGKTSLAVATAQRALDDGWFPGGVLFVDLHGYDRGGGVDSASAITALLGALGIARDDVPPTLGEREALYRSELVGLAKRGHRVLILADNAADQDQVLPLRPPGRAHRMLVTSRETLPIPYSRRVELEALTMGDAMELLTNALAAAYPGDARITAERDAAEKLAALCGRLPLALRISAEILADRPTRTVHELTGLLESGRDPLGELEYGDSLAVRMAFGASYDRLPEDQARLFRLAALHRGPHLTVAALAALADVPYDSARRLAAGVARTHLLQHSAIEGGYRFHDLVRLYAVELCEERETPEARAEAVVRLLDHYCEAGSASNSHLDPRIAADKRATLFPDQRAAHTWAEVELPNVVASVLLATDTGNTRHACDLAEAMPYFMLLGRHFEEWITVSESALAAARSLGDGPSEARALNALGLAYQGRRQFDAAARHLQRSMAVWRGLRDRLGEAKAVSNLGSVDVERGRLETSLGYFQRAFELFRDSEDLVGACQALNNLAYVYSTLGRYGQAADHYRRSLAIVEGFDQGYMLATVLTNVGDSLRATGRFDEALAHHERALTIFTDLGERHLEARTLHNLALVHRHLGLFDEAEAYDRQALPIRREVGDRHGEGLTLENLALVLLERGAAEEAQATFDQALCAFSEIDADSDADRIRDLLRGFAQRPSPTP
ncbi:MAG TPA: tetratricopeptide repeat protein [Actinospica sp.]|nr:tetratricopeptide repeat protein [Actinospica sp.]